MTAAPGAEDADDADRLPRWESAEVAWPLALAGGFAGTWAGLASGVPGVAVLLATAALAPLHLALARRAAPGHAAVLGLGWLAGIAGAVVGGVLEGSGAAVRDALLLWEPLTGAARGVAGPAAAGPHLALFAGALVAAVWTRGLAALLASQAVCACAAWIAADRALPAVREGASAVLATIPVAPAGLCAEALALLLVAVALARRDRARPLLWGALALEILALAGWSLR